MWSRQFVTAGLSSATIFAAFSAFAIWLSFYLVLSPAISTGHMEAGVIFKGVFCVAIGVFVYPACWFYMIQRGRDYAPNRTLELICATYGMSCLIVAAVFCVVMAAVFGGLLFTGFLKMILGSIEVNWKALGAGVLVVAGTPLVALFGSIIGGFIVLPAFIVIATPMAYLHRWLLLRIFAADRPNA